MIYETVKLHIDNISYKNKKDAEKDYYLIKTRLQQYSLPINITIENLLEAIQDGKTVSPAVMKGTTADAFVEQQVFMVDIDNKKEHIPILLVEEAISICKKNHLPLAFYYYTFSHTEKVPKFRLVFIMEEVIRDNTLRLMIIQSLMALFEQADTSCKNADRIFLGTNKEVKICNLKSRITIDSILDIASDISSKSKAEKKDSSLKVDSELDKLKKDFDFFSYLKKRNGKVKYENTKYAMFEKCEICGHKNDLVYFKETNSFYCFGASGNKGGSIIDYIKITEKLDIKQAIDKFKYELCKLKKEKKVIHSITAKELSTIELPKPCIIVRNLLSQGFSIIAGQPKLGKSWLALDLCYCVCMGYPFLDFETTKSACLYLALEDSKSRLKERMEKMLGDKDIPDNLHLATKCEPLNEGLIEELEQKLEEYPDIKLIVIDTLQKVRGSQSRNQSLYDYDYKEIGKLKDFADEHQICILAIHHLRKMKDPSDPFNNISGSTGITGAADTSIVLYKDNFKDSNTIFVTESRDFESIQKILVFDHYKWNVVGDYDGLEKEIEKFSYSTDPIVITINKLLEENPEGVEISSSELLKMIIKTTGVKPKQKKPNTLTKHINETLQYDLLLHDGIHYEPPNENGGSSGRKMFFSKPKKDI